MRTCLSAAVALLFVSTNVAVTAPIPLDDVRGTVVESARSDARSDTLALATIRQLIETGHHPYLTWPDFPHYRDELEGLHGPAPYRLRWLPDGRPTRAALDAVEAMSAAERHGLDPADYDVPRLQELLAEVERDGDLHGTELALVDLALSVGYLRYLSDIHIGRVNPANLHFGYNIEAKKLDLAAVVDEAIRTGEIHETVDRVEPGFPQYGRMVETLAAYREMAEDEPPTVPVVDVVRPGDAYPGIDRLRDRLATLGDLARDSATEDTLYARDLAGAVARFQERHGLEPDSVLGPATFTALNTSIATRVEQLELALERLRWLPELSEPAIVVNIATFELWGLDPSLTDDPVAIHMPVIVGKSLNKQTPAFRGDMEYAVMSPYWNVPYSIAVRELLPAAMRDPDYMTRNRFQIVREFSWDETPLPATAENLAAVRAGRLNLRQMPGGRNSLGHVKFIFPNAENIYLHDTPAHELFDRTRRDFSHGCIRVSDPYGLAVWVLRHQTEWTPDRIASAMDADSPTRADLATSLPVFLFYVTAVATDGPPRFTDDIYGHDEALRAALRVGYPYPP